MQSVGCFQKNSYVDRTVNKHKVDVSNKSCSESSLRVICRSCNIQPSLWRHYHFCQFMSICTVWCFCTYLTGQGMWQSKSRLCKSGKERYIDVLFLESLLPQLVYKATNLISIAWEDSSASELGHVLVKISPLHFLGILSQMKTCMTELCIHSNREL